MISSWRRLTEQQIRKAEVEGKLKGLAGEGKPLPYRPGDAFIDAGEAVGHRIMAEAGALPEEIKLKKALDEARAAYAKITDPAEKKAQMARIAELDMKYAIAREARRRFLGSR
jgi:hypothetical protein